jgi:uncharacterized OsmC-like protein
LAARAASRTIQGFEGDPEGNAMTMHDVAAAMQRAATVLQRRPEIGLHDDAPAAARWMGGTRIVASHANGTEVLTDMPGDLGGSGDKVTPGSLFRAGLASCSATTIAMSAAAQGIELSALEVRASSRSDTRALLGVAEADGEPVYAGPRDVQVSVRIAAHGIAPERLRIMVEDALRRSPVPNALPHPTPFALRIEVE